MFAQITPRSLGSSSASTCCGGRLSEAATLRTAIADRLYGR
jgi:hypothetical protein